MRVNNRGEACYFSFEELATAFNCKPVSKVTKDKEKLAGQQKRFVSKHRCKACGEPMTWINGTSAMACTNPSCKGIKITKENEDGTKTVNYITSFSLLDDVGFEIAENIFSVEI